MGESGVQNDPARGSEAAGRAQVRQGSREFPAGTDLGRGCPAVTEADPEFPTVEPDAVVHAQRAGGQMEQLSAFGIAGGAGGPGGTSPGPGTAGGVLATMALKGYKVVIVACTAGERGCPAHLTVEEYRKYELFLT